MVKDERKQLLSLALKDNETTISKRKADEKTKLLSQKTAEFASNVDRGWAWMVLFGSCICGVMALGIVSNIGVLYVDIQSILGISIFDTSFIGSLQTGSMYLAGKVIQSCTIYEKNQ